MSNLAGYDFRQARLDDDRDKQLQNLRKISNENKNWVLFKDARNWFLIGCSWFVPKLAQPTKMTKHFSARNEFENHVQVTIILEAS